HDIKFILSMKDIRSCYLALLFVVVCFTIRAQPQVNFELLSNAGICDTLIYGIRVVNQDDNTLEPTRFVIHKDEDLVFAGTENNPIVISESNHGESIVPIIGRITIYNKALIEVYFYITYDNAKSRVSSSLAYFFTNSEINLPVLNIELLKPIL